MKRILRSPIVTIGLAIFSMLFGAGNLMYPLVVGMNSGCKSWIGMSAFLVTAVALPLLGLLTMLLFDGNYHEFFDRMGTRIGKLFILASMLIIGPGLVIPRIVTLSHVMMTPFIPWTFLADVTPYSSLVFALIFLGVTFLCTYKESKIVTLLGNVISPLLLISLTIIIGKGLLSSSYCVSSSQTIGQVIINNLILGYGTLDLLGAIFFSSMILGLIKPLLNNQAQKGHTQRLRVGLLSGVLGTSILAAIYCGMAFLGAYFGHGLEGTNAGSLFREISLRVLGSHAALIIAVAVLMACLSTAIALVVVVAEYVQKTLFSDRISYLSALVAVLLLSIPLSIFGLGYVLSLTGGSITYIGYPVLICLTLCNLLYKTTGMNWVKLPVALTFGLALISYMWL